MANRQRELLNTLEMAVDALHKFNQLGNVVTFIAAYGPTEELHQFIARGLSVNIAYHGGFTLLHFAAAFGQTQTCVMLIQLGAEKSRLDRPDRSTPLHLAAQNGHHYTVRAMLEAGCPVDVLNGNGSSVLHFAAGGGNVEVIKEVLSTGYNINATDDNGATPLHYAAGQGESEAVLELISCGAKNAVVAGILGTPLHLAAHGHPSTVKVMLEAGCPTDVLDTTGRSVLHFAAKGGNAEVIRMIMSTACDINAVDSSGWTPLHYAAAIGNSDTALELINHGAKKATVADEYGTPLHLATRNCHPATVSALLTVGCPVDVADGKGTSVLHYAVFSGDPTVIDMLLSRGCNVNATDRASYTPLDCAAMKDNAPAVLKLVRHGANKSTHGGITGGPLLAAAACGCWSTVQVMLTEGFPVDGMAEDGKTLPHYAVIGSEVSLLCQLEKGGINLSRSDRYGLTPLHYATFQQKHGCVRALLELGANATVEEPVLGTALNTARLYGSREIASLLGGTTLQRIDRPDEVIIDLALTDEPGNRSESQYVFSKQGNAVSLFEHVLFSNFEGNKARLPDSLKNILTVFSRHQLVDLSRLVCLAAVHGDATVLECLGDILTAPTKPGQFVHLLKCLFPIQFGQPNDVLSRVLPETEVYPLHLVIIAMHTTQDHMRFHICLGLSSREYYRVIKILATSEPFCHALNECLPNGLTPLDLAEELGLNEAASIISNAGGRQGINARIPAEVKLQHGDTILLAHQQLMKLASSGACGQQALQVLLDQLPGRTTTEQGTSTEESHMHRQMVLDQRPDLSVISTYIISHVRVDQWRRLGISLKIPLEALSCISSTHSSYEDRYLEVLIYWLDHGEAASWRTLLEVLGHFEPKHTMDQLTQDVIAHQASTIQPIFTTQSHLCQVEVGVTPPPPSSQLSPQFVSHVVHYVGVNWYNFALHLGISSTILDAIKVERQSLTSDCCRESLHRWLRHDRDTGGKGREVDVILEAVNKACGPVAVERIQSSLQDSEVQPSSPTPLLRSTPELATLQEFVVPFAAAQWEVVADYLLVSYEKRAAITASERGQVEVCCRELFNQWLRQLPGTGSLPRTWERCLMW